jgi:Bacterial type II and III secretion system protein/FG-GAP-like repeat
MVRFSRKQLARVMLSAVLAAGAAGWGWSAQRGEAQAPSPAVSPATGQAAVNPPANPKRAERDYELGRKAEENHDWQSAYDDYIAASQESPGNREYAVRRDFVRGILIQVYRARAERDALAGLLDEARGSLRAALRLDPGDVTVRSRLRQFESMGPESKSVPVPLAAGIELEPAPGKQKIHLRGNVESAYRALAHQFGLTVDFASDVAQRSVRLDLDEADFETAAEALGISSHTFYTPTGRKRIFVAADTPPNHRLYGQTVVRTVLLPAAITRAQQAETLRVVRDVTGLVRTTLDTSTREMTLRGDPATVELASALINSIEKPQGELMLDFELLEVDRNAASQLGLLPPQSGQVYSLSRAQVNEAEQSIQGLVDVITQVFGQPSSLSGLGAAQVGALVSAGQLGLGSLVPPLLAFGGGATTFLATLPGATVNLSDALSVMQTGQRVLLRAEDGEKATFFVGEKYPVTLGTFAASFQPSQFVPGVSQQDFPTTDYATGAAPDALASADFNGDGFNDLAVANNTDNTVSILLGNGDGTFGAATSVAVGTGPVAIAAADLNADGNADLAVVNQTDGTVSILLGNGDGTFQAPTTLTTGTQPTAIAIADFDADGREDLAVTNGGDNTVSIFLGNGDGTFQPGVTYATGVLPVSIAVGDLNGDGFPDIVVANQTDNTISILLNNGTAAAGSFAARTDYATGNMPTAVAVADFNLDSLLDVVVANQADNTVSVFLNTSTGVFAARTDYVTGNAPVAITVGDYNIDGLPDVAVADKTDNQIAVLINAGQGVLSAPLTLPVGTSPVGILSMDFNGDSRLDVATANEGSNNVSVILNTANFTPSSTTAPQTPFPNSQYEDLGLKITVTPRLMANQEVSLKLAFEIKSLAGTSINGIPILSNRTIEQTVRLREDETSVLSAALQSNEMRAINGSPFLAEQPVADYLAGTHNNTLANSELLILVTPRLVRLAPRKDQVFYAGRAKTGPAFLGPVGRFDRPPF